MFLFTRPASSDLQLLHGLLHELVSGFRPELELLKRFRPRIGKLLGIWFFEIPGEGRTPFNAYTHPSSLPKRNQSDHTLD